MHYKSWEEMTDAEKAEINRQEDEKEAYRDALFAWDDKDVGRDDEVPTVTDDDWDEWEARQEEKGVMGHKDSFYW